MNLPITIGANEYIKPGLPEGFLNSASKRPAVQFSKQNPMNIDLKDKIILITGATGGLGKAMVQAFAKVNATVAVHYNKNETEAKKLATETGNESKEFKADLSNPTEAEALFNEVLQHYKKIDVIINNSGIFEYSPITSDDWFEKWNRTIDTNLNSVGLLCKLAIEHFLTTGGGKIINISSRAAFRGETGDYMAYAASKGALISLTKTIAKSFGKNNIVAFSIAPGFVRTPMVDGFIEENGEEMVLNQIALPKLTEAKDVAPTVVFLASGLADHSTGCTIDINAGSYMR